MVSVGIGTSVWAATGSPLAVPAAAATGVLVDADHLLDFYQWYAKKDRRRVFFLFHAWEYSVIALALVLLFWYHPLLLAAVLGHLGHLAADQLVNRPSHPLTYSIIFRIFSRFDREQTFPELPSTLSEALHGSIPLWRLIESGLIKTTSRLSGKSSRAARRPESS